MKKLAIIFTAIAVLAGCQKEGALQTNADHVTIFPQDKHTITSNGTNVSFSSQNPFVASVNSTTGQVTGLHIGETYIDILADQGTAKVKVTVKPKYNIITDPYIAWGATQSQILDKVGKEPMEEDEDTIMYLYGDANKGDSHIGTNYVFKSGKLSSIMIVINKVFYADAILHLAERFQYVGEKSGTIVYGEAIQESEMNTLVSISQILGQYVILYTPKQ